jgi:hypothetical protein
MQRSPVEIHQHFAVIYCLHLQGLGMNHVITQREAGGKLSESRYERYVQIKTMRRTQKEPISARGRVTRVGPEKGRFTLRPNVVHNSLKLLYVNDAESPGNTAILTLRKN